MHYYFNLDFEVLAIRGGNVPGKITIREYQNPHYSLKIRNNCVHFLVIRGSPLFSDPRIVRASNTKYVNNEGRLYFKVNDFSTN